MHSGICSGQATRQVNSKHKDECELYSESCGKPKGKFCKKVSRSITTVREKLETAQLYKESLTYNGSCLL